MPMDQTAQDRVDMPRFDRAELMQISRSSEQPSSTVAEPAVRSPYHLPTQVPDVGILLAAATLILFLLKIFGILRDDEATPPYKQPVLPCSAAPCPSCRFFSRNIYIRCAVRPTDVLTQQAIDCPDYDPNFADRSSHATLLSKQEEQD